MTGRAPEAQLRVAPHADRLGVSGVDRAEAGDQTVENRGAPAANFPLTLAI
jgi:hypothetical protein